MHLGQFQRRAEPIASRWRLRDRHRLRLERFQLPVEPLQFRLIHAGAGTAGIDQLAVRRVIAQQQRAEIRTPTLGIGEADDDKFILVDAFRLPPDAAVTGLVRRIDAFRDDALDIVLAGRVVERLAVTDDVVDEVDVLRRPAQ